VPLRVPVMRDGNLSYVLTIGLNPSQISGILRHAGAPADWIGAIVDGSGKIVARTVAEEFEAGRLAAPSSLQAISNGRDGFYAGRTIEGLEMETVLRFLPGTDGWTVHFGIPVETLDGPVKRWLILLLAGGAISLALAVLLAILIANDIAQRRKGAEERSRLALLLSESRGALAVDAAMLGTWRWDAETGVVQGSARTADLLSLPRSASGGEWGFGQFANALTASERGRLEESLEAVLRTGSSLDVEVLVAAANRPGRWIRLTGRRSELSLESPATVQGVVADIDAQKRAEADRLNLLRRLAEAQENERRRIARELHDELGQTVTGLSLGLKALEQDLNSSDRERTRPRLSWLQDLTRSVGRDLHRLSTDLRPSSLDDLGLSRAVCSLVANVAERHGLAHICRVPDKPERFSADVETAVFRAIQEALTNVIKHARADRVEVTVRREGARLHACVADDGCGFDIEAVRRSSDEPPLGISGMRERLALVNGTVHIRSGKGAGTTVDVEVVLEGLNDEL
ncbi:ATP-binding protein, partial [Nostoc sp. NIES-2111]